MQTTKWRISCIGSSLFTAIFLLYQLATAPRRLFSPPVIRLGLLSLVAVLLLTLPFFGPFLLSSLGGQLGHLKEGGLEASSADARNMPSLTVGDPDLVIRTGGERRISNFLLYGLAYAELHFADVLWPDFTVAELHRAIRGYASRRRRFGGLDAEESLV